MFFVHASLVAVVEQGAGHRSWGGIAPVPQRQGRGRQNETDVYWKATREAQIKTARDEDGFCRASSPEIKLSKMAGPSAGEGGSPTFQGTLKYSTIAKPRPNQRSPVVVSHKVQSYNTSMLAAVSAFGRCPPRANGATLSTSWRGQTPQASTKQGYCSLVHSAVAHGKRSNSGTLGGVDTPDASIDVPMIPRQVGNFARSQCWQLGTLCLFVGRELLIVVIVVVVASM
ncbi:hypothetical protein B0T13DRAFT_503759 [Neurospora crassa]|nr:hypothetical protein B0T13DRAFT_503759 [Neurospora crassa]